MTRLSWKVGDTFVVTGICLDDDDEPVDLTNAQIDSAVRLDAGLLWVLECEIADQAVNPGKYAIRGATDTWPADEELQWDVQLTMQGIVSSSPTVTIVTLPDVTPAPEL